jgi:glycosyltransferase involved in cell wall biosynthesis
MKDYSLPDDKITVFPWGIDLSQFKKTDKKSAKEKFPMTKDKFVVIYNRHLEPVYGATDLLEGFKIFSNGKNDVLLIMLSEGAQKNTVVKFIAENKLEEKINLTGRTVNAELPAFLNSSDVYISTSLSDGSSLSLLEAMACGLGIVVTDVPAIKEWVNEQNGLVVPRENPGEIAKALEQYYNNRELLSTHGEVSVNIAKEKADWDMNYQKLKEIYNKLMNIK